MAIVWCASTLGAPELGLDGFLDLARRFSLGALELRFLNDSLDIGAEIDKYLAVPGNAAKLKASGLTFPVVGTSFKLCTAGEEDRKLFRSAAQAADRIGAHWLRVFDGPEWGEAITPEHMRQARENVAEWREWRTANGVKARMAIEVHGACSSTLELMRFFAGVGGRMPIVWDVHHSLVAAGEPLQETWDRIGNLVCHVHVKDSVDKPSARHPYTLVLPGQGRVDGRGIVAFLKRQNYDGAVSLEWERRWHPYLPPLEEALAALETSGWR